MSEKKNVIEIPVPAGYEQCGCDNADHILVDGWAVCELINGGRRRIMDPVRPHGETCTDQLGPRITAYLREVPNPEPFRVVFDSEIVRFKSREVDNHGYCYDVVESYGVELPGGVDPYREYKKVRVTIEEVLPNE